jgi:flagellar hook-length control protein FliK
MEQTISTATAPATTAAPAAAGLVAATAAAPETGAETDVAAQFSALLGAITDAATDAPVATAAVAEQAEASKQDAEAATSDASAAAAGTLVVPATILVAVQPLPALPVSVTTDADPASPQAAVTAAVAPADAGQIVLATVTPAAATTMAAPDVTATAPTGDPVAAIVLPSSPALPDGDVDPALVEAAIAAAADTAPAKPATATAKAAPKAVSGVGKAATETSPAEAPATTVQPASETTTDTPVEEAKPADHREGGSSAGTGHGGRLDLQVQAAPRTRELAPDAAVETPVAIMDRERVERLAEGLAARLKVSHAADGARIRMQLEPRELGEVVVRLEIRNGIAHAHLIAESADAKAALQATLADLRSSLSERGVQLDSVSIRVAGEGAGGAGEGAGQPQADRRARAPLSFGRIDLATTLSTPTDLTDRAREGQAVWMLA